MSTMPFHFIKLNKTITNEKYLPKHHEIHNFLTKIHTLDEPTKAMKISYTFNTGVNQTGAGQAKGRRRAGEGQAKGRRRAGEGQAKGRRRAGEGQAKGRRRAGEGQAKGRRRRVTTTNTVFMDSTAFPQYSFPLYSIS